jgi:hypothetical protein
MIVTSSKDSQQPQVWSPSIVFLVMHVLNFQLKWLDAILGHNHYCLSLSTSSIVHTLQELTSRLATLHKSFSMLKLQIVNDTVIVKEKESYNVMEPDKD